MGTYLTFPTAFILFFFNFFNAGNIKNVSDGIYLIFFNFFDARTLTFPQKKDLKNIKVRSCDDQQGSTFLFLIRKGGEK